MAGYMGYSRSVNSLNAIEEFEVPLSHIKKNLIKDFIAAKSFSKTEADQLLSFTVSQWKAAAETVGAASWHHTSKMYNRTSHYSLDDVAGYLLTEGVPAVKEDASVLVEGKRQTWIGQGRKARRGPIVEFKGAKKGDWCILADGKKISLLGTNIIYWQYTKSN